MLDHISICVSDYERSKAFYTKVLEPLGSKLVMEFGPMGGFGVGRKPTFWIYGGRPSYFTDEHRAGGSPVHVCFTAKNREEVDAFYAAAIAAGGKDFGKPGLRTEYHPKYYGGFVLDPDGNDIEACFHGG
jgi:catechol 2,3-dioxygenase-like lactoylglutathione lyase family enzyme